MISGLNLPAKKEGVDEKNYFDIILNLYPNSFKSMREINEKDRLKAGFSEEELSWIKNFSKERS